MARKNERINFLSEVELEFASGRTQARISDLGEGGCYVDTIASVPSNEPISVELRSSDGTSMRFTGRVAFVISGNGFGIEFVEGTPEHKAFLKKIIGKAKK